MESNNINNLEKLLLSKPKQQLQEATPEIRDYILALEQQLKAVQLIETHYNELNQKYLDVQEDTFTLQIQMIEAKRKIKELTEANEKLRQENDNLKKGNFQPCCVLPEPDTTATLKSEESSNDPKINSANSILLKGAPRRLFATYPIKGVVHLAKLMDLQFSEKDVRTITPKSRKFYERQNMQPDKLIFIVEFGNSETKINFLKHKEKLKQHPHTKDIAVTDYVSEEVYNLYQYTKVLKSCGYDLIYWRNNSVYAKKTRSSNSQAILIESTKQVDVLKNLK